MPRFFTTDISDNKAIISGEDARHITGSLRMCAGESLTLCDLNGNDYECVITKVSGEAVFLDVLGKTPCKNEPRGKISLYQALPKADKFELIAQKAVELGIFEITPVLTSRCVSRWKDSEKKIARIQKIMAEAAKQSGRGIIPRLQPLCEFEDGLERMKTADYPIMFYEEEKTPLSGIIKSRSGAISVMIGSEGGFSREEAERARQNGVITASLGSRILRTETAAICAVSAISLICGEF